MNNQHNRRHNQPSIKPEQPSEPQAKAQSLIIMKTNIAGEHKAYSTNPANQNRLP